jgi:hypothetical protein
MYVYNHLLCCVCLLYTGWHLGVDLRQRLFMWGWLETINAAVENLYSIYIYNYIYIQLYMYIMNIMGKGRRTCVFSSRDVGFE